MIINKEHPEISSKISRKHGCYITVTKRGFYFTHQACEMFKLEIGNYIQFDHSDFGWSLFQNTDPRGFMLRRATRARYKGLRVDSASLSKLFRDKTKMSIATRLQLTQSNALMFNQFPLITIETSQIFKP